MVNKAAKAEATKKLPNSSMLEETKTPSKPRKKDEFLNAAWKSGTQLIDWIINEEYNADLSWQSWIEKFEMMRKSDAQVFATLLAMELPIRSTAWKVLPATNEDGETDDAAREVQRFVQKNLFEKMSSTWNQFLQEALTMLPFWFSIFEKVYWIDAEWMIFLKKLWFRKQNTIFKRQQEDGTAGIQQVLPEATFEWPEKWKQTVNIPASKLLVFSFRREGDNYAWTSVLRSAYKHRYIKDKLYRYDAIKHERQAVWIPVIYWPTDMDDDDLAEAQRIVWNIRSNESTGVVMPGSKDDWWLLEFADMKANSWSDLFESIKHHNREIAKNILAQFLELGDTASWSRSLSEDQSDLFLLSLTAVAQQIEDVVNRFLIPELVDLNFDVEDYPKIQFAKLGDTDYQKFATMLATLTGASLLTPDENIEDFIREEVGLPARIKDEMKDGEDDSEKWWTPKKKEPKKPTDDGGSDDEVPTKSDAKDTKDTTTAKDVKDEATKASEHADWCACDFHSKDELFLDEEYLSMSSMFNNSFIIKLQNECSDAESYAKLKNKWFKFNEYEKESPRPLTFAEKKVNFTSLKRAMDTFNATLEESVNNITSQQKADLLEQIKKAVEANDIAAVWQIKAKRTGELSQALTDVQKELFEIWKKTAATEMNVKVPPTKAEVRGAMRVQNDAVINGIVWNIETAAKTAVSEAIAKRAGSITATSSTEAIAAASQNLDKVFEKAKATLNTLWITGAVNLWRASIFERYPEKIYWFQYSAILDDRTTETCRSLDGRVVKAWSQEFYDYAPPRHYRCRSIRVEILMEETFKPKFTWIPSGITANVTIDTFKDLKAPIVLKNSPAIKIIQQEIDERKTKLEELMKSGQFPNRQEQHKARITELENSLAKAEKSAFNEYVRNILKSDWIDLKMMVE